MPSILSLFGGEKITKSESPATNAAASVVDASATASGSTQVTATWQEGKSQRRQTFGPGRHLIGDSGFAQLRVGQGGKGLCGSLDIAEEKVRIRCSAPKPVMFVEGRRLAPGDEIVVADLAEFIIGNIPVMLAVQSRTETAVRAKSPGADFEPRSLASHAAALRAASGQGRNASGASLPEPNVLVAQLSRALLEQLNVAGIALAKVDSPEVRETTRLKLRKLVSDLSVPRSYAATATEIEQRVFDEVMGLGPLEPLLKDPAVTEIMVNRCDQIYLERAGQLTLSPVHFSSDQALMNVIERIVSSVGRRIDQSSPIVDARLLDGSRVNAVIPPLALRGPCLTIRRFSKKPISVEKLIEFGSLTSEMAKFLEAMVCQHKNIIISGGTGSGKTTLLNALSGFVPEAERIVTVEDAAELQLQQEHVISLETRPANLEGKGAVAIRDLVKNTLRMRPDRIIVGECRGGEALDMLQAMNTGHDGSMTTAHANSAEDMLRRLETMVLMAGMDLPLRAIREQVASAVTLVVQQTRRKTGRRLVTGISWVRNLNRETGEYEVFDLFRRDQKDNVVRCDETIERFWSEEELTGSPWDLVAPPSGSKRKKDTRRE